MPKAADASVFELDVDGLRVLLRRNRASEVVALRFYVRGGAAHLDATSAGAEMMYARAARRGTQRYPKTDLNATLAPGHRRRWLPGTTRRCSICAASNATCPPLGISSPI
jgi:hypothetical protein